MNELNLGLLSTIDSSEDLHSSHINGTSSRGVYSPMQFVLRLRKDVHQELKDIKPGIRKSLSENQKQAFSTYLHETIHWWQHVGSNFGLISSLKYPAQAHINYENLQELLKNEGAFKSISKFDRVRLPERSHPSINRVLNNWHDIEQAGKIIFDPIYVKRIAEHPYFDCVGHSFNMMWGASLWTLGATIDKEFTFLPNIKQWSAGFKELRDKKVYGYYWGSPISVPPLGTKAVFEGQARFNQLQYLYAAYAGRLNLNDFANKGLLNGVYIQAFNLFLEILEEERPLSLLDPLVGLFLLICDVSINPVDGFPIDIYHYELFLYSVDPGHRFYFLCRMVKNKLGHLKTAIQNYSKEEYIVVSKILSESISCFSPYEGTICIYDWIQTGKLRGLLEEEQQFKFQQENLPIRLFFSKFIRFQEDKFKHPQFFCWPGIHFSNFKSNVLSLPEVEKLFNKHAALFVDDLDGDIYPQIFEGYNENLITETFNQFFNWSAIYDMTRKWVIEDGPFTFDYQWLTSKYTKAESVEWASKHFEQSYGVRPEEFKII